MHTCGSPGNHNRIGLGIEMMDEKHLFEMEECLSFVKFELVNHPGFIEGEFNDILEKLDRIEAIMNLI